MLKGHVIATIAAACLVSVSTVQADVFHMGGTRNADGTWTGLASLETVTVGNPGNVPDARYESAGYGSVDYAYKIGKFEITAGQYCEFLNAIAATDTNGLYNVNMWPSSTGCKIQQHGSQGSYTYSVGYDWANRPVNWVSYWDACRFVNWLHNGQPTGAQGPGTTEDGSYTNLPGMSVVREPGATWVLPSEDEWYKAAYHKNDGVTANYFDYPTSSNAVPGYVDDEYFLSETHAKFFEGGADTGNYATYNGDGGSEGINSPYFRSVVGEWEESSSPYGTFDQGGNVWEWNEAVIGTTRGLRGGSFRSDLPLGSEMRASFRPDYYGTSEHNQFGFRVALIPEPGSSLLLALGGLMLRRRG